MLIAPSQAFTTASISNDIPSLNYIYQAHGQISLVPGEEDYYVVSQNPVNGEISNTNKNKNNHTSVIFGEDAFTEDNILKHYVFSKEKLEKNRSLHKILPTSIND